MAAPAFPAAGRSSSANQDLGNSALERGELQRAMGYFSAAQRLQGSNPTPRLLTELAETYNALGDFKNGHEMAVDALERDSSFADAFLHKADALHGLGKLHMALDVLVQGLEVEPQNAEMLQGHLDVCSDIWLQTLWTEDADLPPHLLDGMQGFTDFIERIENRRDLEQDKHPHKVVLLHPTIHFCNQSQGLWLSHRHSPLRLRCAMYTAGTF